MTEEEITKMFENRWRIKSASFPNASVKGFKDFCRDFFEAGIELATPAETVEPPDFKIWWKLYDKQVAKGKCISKWNKLSAEAKRKCVEKAPEYVASTPDKAYRKNPLTYLNSEGWNDEIIFKNNGQQSQQPTIDQQRVSKLADIIAG